MRYDKEVDSMLEQFAMPLSITRLGSGDPKETISSPPYRLLMLLDPSGVLSIPDVIFSTQETIKNPTRDNIILSVISLICVVPALSVGGKAVRAAIWGGNFTFAFTKLTYLIPIVLAGIIEGAGFVMSILMKMDEQSQKQITQNLKWVESNLTEEDIINLHKSLQTSNK